MWQQRITPYYPRIKVKHLEKRRRQFYNKLLTTTPEVPHKAFPSFQTWRHAQTAWGEA